MIHMHGTARPPIPPNTHTRVQWRRTCVFLETNEGQNKENVLEGGASLRNTEVSWTRQISPATRERADKRPHLNYWEYNEMSLQREKDNTALLSSHRTHTPNRTPPPPYPFWLWLLGRKGKKEKEKKVHSLVISSIFSPCKRMNLICKWTHPPLFLLPWQSLHSTEKTRRSPAPNCSSRFSVFMKHICSQ